MTTEYLILDEHQAIVISMSGEVGEAEANTMRGRAVELVRTTGFRNFIVDLSELLSIEGGSTFSAYTLGDKFRDSGFPLDAKTAVIMPVNEAAREQAEFLHTVEVNRGRGVIKYVDNIDHGLDWFRSLST